MLIIAALAIVGLAVAGVAYATSGRDSGPSASSASSGSSRSATTAPASTTAATPDIGAAVARWLGDNVPKNAAILAADSTVRRLQAAGYTAVTSAPGATVSWVVSDSAVRAGRNLFDVTGSLSRSVAVASFGTGAQQVQVASVLDGSIGGVQQMVAQDGTSRRLAGGELAVNPGLHASAGELAILRGGQLDLRAETFLALLAADATVDLEALPQDPAERVADRAHRTLLLTSSPSEIATVLRSLPAPYAPQQVSTRSGVTTIVWSAAITDLPLAQ